MKVDQIIKKYQEIVPAKRKGVNLYGMKKDDLIRLVQHVEPNSSPCYKSDRSSYCSQTDCCWFKGCTRHSKNI